MQVKQTQHKVSQFLVDRHPYIEEAKSEKLEVCVALGRRGVAKLAEILVDDTQTDAEIGQALDLLCGLLTTQEKKIEAIKAKVVAAATAIMGRAEFSAGTRTRAGHVLGSLAQVLQGRAAIAASKTVPVLTQSCLDADTGVRQSASDALFHLTSFRDGWAIVMDTPRAVKELVQSLDDHPPSISVFANFTSFFNEGAVAALKYGVMPKIVSVMRAATDLTLRKHSTMTLRNILNNDVGKEKAIRYGAVDAAAEKLTDDDAQVRAMAAGAIQTMCVNQEAKPLFLEVRTGVRDLAALLRDDSADVRHNATLAIRNLSDLPAAKTEFVGELAGSLDLLKSVFGAACAEPLCELLESKDPDVRANAAVAFDEFTKSADDRLQVVNALHIVRRLASVLTEVDQKTAAKRSAAKALQALCQSYPDAAKKLRLLARGDDGAELRRSLMSFEALRAIALAQ